MTEFDDAWTPTSGGIRRQRTGRIRGRGRNSEIAPLAVVAGVPPNRASRRHYQRTVTPRGQRKHIVLFGAWRSHDGRQQLKARWALRRGENRPEISRADTRAAWLDTYRAHRKNRSRRVTLGHDA